VIKKRKGKWCVLSPNNPDWSGGCYRTKKEAEARLRQVEKAKYARRGQRGVRGLDQLTGIVKDYVKRIREMRQLEEQADIEYDRGRDLYAESLLKSSRQAQEQANAIYSQMSHEERKRVENVRSFAGYARPSQSIRRRRLRRGR